jgi:hypothetical protein
MSKTLRSGPVMVVVSTDPTPHSAAPIAQDKNNLQVDDVIMQWIDEHVEDGSGEDDQ